MENILNIFREVMAFLQAWGRIQAMKIFKCGGGPIYRIFGLLCDWTANWDCDWASGAHVAG